MSEKIKYAEIVEDYSVPYCKNDEDFFDSVNYVYSIMDLPVFTLNPNVKEGVVMQYIFSAKDQSCLRVIPTRDLKILQEADEKIFSTILRIAEYQKSAVVITDFPTLAKASGVSYQKSNRIKDAIERLKKCSLEFNNIKNVSYRGFQLLSEFEIITFKKPEKAAESDIEKVAESDIEKAEKHLLRFFNEETDKRISDYLRNKQNLKYLLVLRIADEIFSDIQNGHFLTFDKKTLFSLTFAARRLFLLLKQQQIAENKHQFSCAFIASRMPLSYKGTNVPKTLDNIEEAAEMLKEKGLITDYCLTRKKPLKYSYIDFTLIDGE